MNKKMFRIISLTLIFFTSLQVTATGCILQSNEIVQDSPHIDYIANPGKYGFNIVIWNFGTAPAYFIFWEIETKSVDGSRVIGGNRRGIIPCLRSKDTQYMAPLSLPKTKNIRPYGSGEIEITVTIYCRNADFEVTQTSNWLLNGFSLTPMYHHR